jgi:hypothetical protein
VFAAQISSSQPSLVTQGPPCNNETVRPTAFSIKMRVAKFVLLSAARLSIKSSLSNSSGFDKQGMLKYLMQK